jgi:hypothetical protein
MTVETCIQFCDEKGYIYAGTEFGVSVYFPYLPFKLFFSLFRFRSLYIGHFILSRFGGYATGSCNAFFPL